MKDATPPPTGARQRELLHEMLQKQGLVEGEYALFFVTGEGHFFLAGPVDGPIEETSGYVITQDGRVFAFWLGQHPETGRFSLTEWEQVEPEPHWADNSEYQRARKTVGLAA